MSLKTETTRIGEHDYSVTQWNATKSMVMKLKTAKYLGGFIEAIGELEGNIQTELMKSLGSILDSVDPEAFVEFVKEVACSAVKGGERMSKSRFDEYFAGDILAAYSLAFFVLKVNYEDFLASVLNLRNEK